MVFVVTICPLFLFKVFPSKTVSALCFPLPSLDAGGCVLATASLCLLQQMEESVNGKTQASRPALVLQRWLFMIVMRKPGYFDGDAVNLQ